MAKKRATNVGQTSKNFRRAARKVAYAARKVGKETGGPGIRLIGEEIMLDVKASRAGHGVPVKRGILRSTGRVEGPDAKQNVELSFGGPAAPYAVIQHETLHYHHRVGEARYLVRGMERWEPGGSVAWEALRRSADAALKRVAKRNV